jgi:hypothetical protein
VPSFGAPRANGLTSVQRPPTDGAQPKKATMTAIDAMAPAAPIADASFLPRPLKLLAPIRKNTALAINHSNPDRRIRPMARPNDFIQPALQSEHDDPWQKAARR